MMETSYSSWLKLSILEILEKISSSDEAGIEALEEIHITARKEFEKYLEQKGGAGK